MSAILTGDTRQWSDGIFTFVFRLLHTRHATRCDGCDIYVIEGPINIWRNGEHYHFWCDSCHDIAVDFPEEGVANG